MATVIGLFREAAFSRPGGDDQRILTLTGKQLAQLGFRVAMKSVQSFLRHPGHPPLIFSMCQGFEVLQALRQLQQEGTLVINTPQAILNCYRTKMAALLSREALRVPRSVTVDIQDPPLYNKVWPEGLPSSAGLWVKGGDVHTTCQGTVVFVREGQELEAALRDYRRRGIRRAVLQEHIPGREVKCYGLKGEPLLHWCFRGPAPLQPLDTSSLCTLFQQAAELLGLEIYGGDAMITAQGVPYLIDMNDWPSFQPCQPLAAERIAAYIALRAQALGVK